jgi:threonine/homoserine/homoserine lactone efflux protein
VLHVPASSSEETCVFGIHDYWLFLGAGLLLNLTPGQDTMFIIGRSLTGGLRSGIAAALGISVGSIVHTLAAALGLSLILATSAFAFTLVKLMGAAYLIYLGTKLLLAKSTEKKSTLSAAAASARPHSTFFQGILTNLLNPKVALFFLAFLPQFIEPTSSAKTLAFLALGATFISTGLTWCLVLALGAARLQAFLQRRPNVRALIDRAVGGLFVALGARLAWSR